MKYFSNFAVALSIVALIIIAASCGPDKKERSKSKGRYNAVLFAVNGNAFPENPVNLEQSSARYPGINFSGTDAFWQGHKNFFVHAMGLLDFPKEGIYTLRLFVRGKVVFRINNVDQFNISTASDTTITKSSYFDAGKNIFEFEYYDAGLDPTLTLEWSSDGTNFSIVPDSAYFPIEKQVIAADTSKVVIDNGPHNVLTAQEQKEGWKLLFDGTTTRGWHRYNSPGTIGSKWVAENGELMFKGRTRFSYTVEGRLIEMGPVNKVADGGVDIVTDLAFQNFELMLDWKISKGGNSGIFYTVFEDPQYDEAWKTSPEMQVLDNDGHKDGLIYKHRSGDLYDLIASNPSAVRKAGEWNRVRIVKNNGKVEHWLNGIKVVEYDYTSAEWKDMIAKSKFSSLADYATASECKIALQDHDNPVSFRNIKIKELK